MSPSRPPLVLVANARMPSQRAQSLQVAQAAGAFARAGAATTLLYAKRRGTPLPGATAELWQLYGVPGPPFAEAHALPCWDWIDRAPRRLQYGPARLQELTFARNAARAVRRDFAGARVLSRELETAHQLGRRAGVFLEVHRVPGGRARRRWLSSAAAAGAGVVAISGGVREDLIELGVSADSITVEHDAFEPQRFAQLPTRKEARAALGLDPERPVVVYTGGLLGWKGVEVLVHAALYIPAQVVIAGGMDADVERLRALAVNKTNVRIDGFQPPERVPLYLAAADVGVVPNRAQPAISARYTSPLKIFEAMAAGLPLVVSDLPSMRDILGQDEALFVRPDEPRDLCIGVCELLEDPARRAALSAAMRARAPLHTWDARAERLLDWMEARA